MQTWNINGRSLNHAQLLEYKKKKAKEDPEKEVETPETTAEPEKTPKEDVQIEEKAEEVQTEQSTPEETPTEEPEDPEKQEFEELTKQKAWLKPALKARYAELKAKFNS
jgi:hypothetical protein